MRERLILLLLLAAPWTHGEYLVGSPSFLWDAAGESGSGSTPELLRAGESAPPVEAAGSGGGGSGSGMPFVNLPLPVCLDDELLEFNGTSLLCKKIPERNCTCPGPVMGSGDRMVFPEPPSGCPVFQPPEGGAFVCMLMDLVMYCSVLCDNEHEFSTFPLNPYFCGFTSNFVWTDFTNVTHEELPKCTGFRYTLRTLHREQFYLPGQCNSLTAEQVDTAKKDFCCLLIGIPTRTFCERIDCDIDDIFLQCAP